MTDTFAPVVTHPLEPLTPQEISRTSAIVVRERNLTSAARFVYIELLEPTEADLQQPDTDRRAFVVPRDRNAHAAVEVARGQQCIGATPIPHDCPVRSRQPRGAGRMAQLDAAGPAFVTAMSPVGRHSAHLV